MSILTRVVPYSQSNAVVMLYSESNALFKSNLTLFAMKCFVLNRKRRCSVLEMLCARIFSSTVNSHKLTALYLSSIAN